ncbi:MAG: ABC transporter ATP-binding protein, partial [Solobacterium sp.]|nr:ABC transporter ATP-binding protein [Solobacterium sp.]
MVTKEPLLHVENLHQHFKVGRKAVTRAVDGISFDIYEGETYGLVGESGSGKSTTGRAIIRLYQPTDGKIIFDGRDISSKLTKENEAYLRTNMQMIFQDPMACLNPRKKVKEIIAEGLRIHKICKTQEEIDEKVYQVLDKVGLSKEQATRFPHQFSGGQRQRVGIA